MLSRSDNNIDSIEFININLDGKFGWQWVEQYREPFAKLNYMIYRNSSMGLQLRIVRPKQILFDKIGSCGGLILRQCVEAIKMLYFAGNID
eukprot:264955_1